MLHYNGHRLASARQLAGRAVTPQHPDPHRRPPLGGPPPGIVRRGGDCGRGGRGRQMGGEDGRMEVEERSWHELFLSPFISYWFLFRGVMPRALRTAHR